MGNRCHRFAGLPKSLHSFALPDDSKPLVKSSACRSYISSFAHIYHIHDFIVKFLFLSKYIGVWLMTMSFRREKPLRPPLFPRMRLLCLYHAFYRNKLD